METAIKPYPACRYAHAPLDMLIDLTSSNSIEPYEIESIDIGMSDAGVDLIGRPLDRKVAPQNIVDAQFSMPFLAAVAATRRRISWSDYELLGDPAIHRLARKVHVDPDEECNRVFPQKWLATVTIRARGQTFSDKSWRTRGEPESPMLWPEVEQKFMDLADPVVGSGAATRIVRTIRRLETLKDVRGLGKLLRVAGEAPGLPAQASAGRA